MKTPLTYILLTFLLLSCSNENRLTYVRNEIVGEECDNCPLISINFPYVIEKSKIGENINSALVEEISSILLFDENGKASDINRAIESFKQGYLDLNQLYTDEGENWEAKITGKITYEDKNTLSIALDAYIFTGGAHGYSSKRFLNFSKKNGQKLENWQLFKSRTNFKRFAEHKFRQQEKIPEDKPINYTGFMFEKDSFYLPENIGFTEKGVKLLYNEYEVASYADGPIELILPYAEVRKYLKEKINPKDLISSTSFEESE